MLDDMPRQSTALMAHSGTGVAHYAEGPAGSAAKTRRGSRALRQKVVRPSALGMLLRPIGIAVGLVLVAYALLSLGMTFYRSYYRHLDHNAAVHPDQSVFDVFFPSKSLPPDAVDLIVRDVDGSLHKVVASKSETDAFVNDTILMLDQERARIKEAAHQDLDRTFALAFQDREETVDAYAGWFFAWKRSYIVLKETVSSAVTRFFEVGKYESLTEAIAADVEDYFLRNYKEQVLKPEIRDKTITAGVEQAVRHAHDSYRRVIANSDMRLQLFLAKHTSHMEDMPATASMTNVKLDWDAQKWKAPVYLMEDRAFDGVVGVGTAAAGGTVGALALGPAINGIIVRSFGQLSRRMAVSMATRVTPAVEGAAIGTAVQPMGGQVIGAALGVVIGFAVDYLANEASEALNRESFVAANEEALDATVAAWQSGLEASVDTAIDKWFDDARASVVLASK